MTGRCKSEPVPNDLAKIFEVISHYHGPNRYSAGHGEINGAVAHLEESPEFTAAVRAMDFSKMPDAGDGAIWGWFVGSPRAFLFGFERTKSWAVRRMNANLYHEAELVTGKKWPRTTRPETMARAT